MNGELEIVMRAIDELREAPYNPRRLTKKQFDDLCASLRRLGPIENAVVNMFPGRENTIISGHQRIKCWQALGHTHYPCHEVQFDEEKEREAVIRMNKNTGEWDLDVLANEFEIADLVEFGFKATELSLPPLSELNADGADATGLGGEGDEKSKRAGTGGPVIHYDIIFEDEQQLSIWQNFIAYLRRQFPEHETIAGRLTQYLEEFGPK